VRQACAICGGHNPGDAMLTNAVPSTSFGLGLDAGGTATRWALSDGAGLVVHEGQAAGVQGMASRGESDPWDAVFQAIAAQVLAIGKPARIVAALSGFDPNSAEAPRVRTSLTSAFSLRQEDVFVCNDLITTYLAVSPPGQSHVIYAGTGSVGIHIDSTGQLHRAGGRGLLLDDAGGGAWIAKEALCHVWRLIDDGDDAASTVLGQALFSALGAADWSTTRHAVYVAGRGRLGLLALSVAACADQDPFALALMKRAGRELGRIAQALIRQCGPRPVVLCGRAAALHPAIFEAMAEYLQADVPLRMEAGSAQMAAAQIAANPSHPWKFCIALDHSAPSSAPPATADFVRLTEGAHHQ
jgi:glucosamine kinase